jgi:carboxylesterase type B
MRPSWILAAAFVQLLHSTYAALPPQTTATTLNGTYQGLYLPEWDQDLFLGIPYAQPPLGPLRFRWPESLNESWNGVRDASQYGYSCMQYDSIFNISEDCLNLNVVRPAGVDREAKLPVLVWIFGGGLFAGSSADPQYNLSGIVKVSQDMGTPIIAASLNYRLGMWGFLQTPELLSEGSSNAGFLDQRLALRWIHENIASFGGDPDRVVIWGESAGAQSVAYQLFSYDGRNDGLYRGAIMESGGPTGTNVQDLSFYASPVENLTRTVGCWTADDQLTCLRGLSQDALFAAQPSQTWNPLIDGTFLTGYPSQLIRQRKFNRVALLIGADDDEGTSFAPNTPLVPNTEEDIFQNLMTWRQYALTPPTIRRILELYPNDPCVEPPMYITNCSIFPSQGLQWRRAAAIGGDMVMISGRRKMCELYTGAGQSVYSYRFDTRLWNKTAILGVTHFDNVAYSFQNITGLLGPMPEYERDAALSRAVGMAYVSFVNNLDPNHGLVGSGGSSSKVKRVGTEGVTAIELPQWPKYELLQPTNMVLNASGPYIEADTWRQEGITYLNTFDVARQLLA